MFEQKKKRNVEGDLRLGIAVLDKVYALAESIALDPDYRPTQSELRCFELLSIRLAAHHHAAIYLLEKIAERNSPSA